MLWVDKKYLRLISSRFRNSKWKNEDLLNHSCPYCGDSEKNPHKARGYHFVYKDTFMYKCHNCGVATGLTQLIEPTFLLILGGIIMSLLLGIFLPMLEMGNQFGI